MSFLNIDKIKCKSDGLCVKECPIQILKMDDATKLPVGIPSAKEICINCGHCVAICPHGALSLETMPVEECKELDNRSKLSEEQIEFLLKSRRSVRLYKKEPVSKEVFEKLIDMARYSPSGINRQPVRWLILHDTEKVQKLAGLMIEWMKKLIAVNSPLAQALRMQNMVNAWEKGEDRICRRAPHLIFAYALKEDMGALQDCVISMTYLELAASALNLGTCWAGYVNIAVNMEPEIAKFLGLSQRCSCYGAMMIGYPAVKYQRIPLRNKAKINWIE